MNACLPGLPGQPPPPTLQGICAYSAYSAHGGGKANVPLFGLRKGVHPRLGRCGVRREGGKAAVSR